MRGTASAPPSIAVLPFVNMSADSTNEYFSDGVTEEITGALAQLGRVRVTPRTTAFAYKGRSGDIRQIGQELGVSRILEGSVRHDRTRVVFVASLYDATNGERLWSNRYERDWGTVLALQTEIAGTIAEQLRLTLVPAERTRLAGRHTVNADAYDSYLKGRHFFDLRTSLSMPQALSHFQRALTIDSTYARAYAGLADTYSLMAWTGLGSPLELFPHAERAAQRALTLDSTIAEAWVSLGVIHTFHTWDWPAADRAMTRALALDSTSAVAWFFRAWPLVALGRMDEALSSIRRSRQLDPFALITNARIGTALSWMGRLPEAEAALRATLELDAQYPIARAQLARVLSLQGKHDEALAVLPPDSVRFGSYESGITGFVLARAGLRDRALAAAQLLESRPSVPGEGVAAIYAALGDRPTALTWLERAVDTRGVGLIFAAVEPMYTSLRREPRYERIVQQLKLVKPSG
jgi:TolB-like protein